MPNSGFYFCGDNGLIIKSPNLDDFIYQNSWVTNKFYNIDFLNADSGLFVGASGIVLKTQMVAIIGLQLTIKQVLITKFSSSIETWSFKVQLVLVDSLLDLQILEKHGKQ